MTEVFVAAHHGRPQPWSRGAIAQSEPKKKIHKFTVTVRESKPVATDMSPAVELTSRHYDGDNVLHN